jgi:heat shock protein HtpX
MKNNYYLIMGLIKLRATIVGTIALIIALSTLFFTIVLSLAGVNLYLVIVLVVAFNFIQWLLAPKLIDAIYRTKELPQTRYSKLYTLVKSICQKTRLAMPKLMIADIPIPNAFAYGSPLSGNKVAVTTGLLGTLEEEEVEAVLGHELGHLKHKDVQTMMFVSVLPAICYYIAYMFILSSIFGGRRDSRDGGAAIIIGFAAMAFYFILNLIVLGLSRLREYYADQYSARNVDDGSRKLSEALAKISTSTSNLMQRKRGTGNVGAFKALFISDPDKAREDATSINQSWRRQSDRELVQNILTRKISGFERFTEIFSTHPNMVKRLRALQKKI